MGESVLLLAFAYAARLVVCAGFASPPAPNAYAVTSPPRDSKREPEFATPLVRCLRSFDHLPPVGVWVLVLSSISLNNVSTGFQCVVRDVR